jgi:multidrug efflux pump subunit AcrA (membrane-fusion protein)
MNNSQSRGFALSFILMTIIASATVLSGCEREEEERVPVVRPVKILVIGEGGGGRTLSYSGQIRAGETAEIGFEVAGRIIELPVTEGQAINEGDMVARLDPADFQARLDQATANHRQAQVTFERFEEIVESGAVSRQQLDRSGAGWSTIS